MFNRESQPNRFKVGQIWEDPREGAIKIIRVNSNTVYYKDFLGKGLWFLTSSPYALSLKFISDGCSKEDSPRNTSFQEQLTELKVAISDLTDEVYGRNLTKGTSLLTENKKLIVQVHELQEELQQFEAGHAHEMQTLDVRCHDLSKALRDEKLDRQSAKAAINLSSYKEEIRGLKQDLYNLQIDYDTSCRNNRKWREANLDLSDELDELKENYQDLQVNYDSSVRANGHLCEQNSTLTRQLEQLKDQNHTLLRNYETFQDEHNILFKEG